MTDLRWILIAGGAILLLGIYLWGRRKDGKSRTESVAVVRPEPPVEPVFDEPSWSGADDSAVDDWSAEEQPQEDFPARAAPRAEPSAGWRREPVPYAESVPSRGRGRVEPTLGDSEPFTPVAEEDQVVADVAETAELPVNEPVAAPTLGMSSTPSPRRVERRKIIALRLAASSQRFPGEALRTAMEEESLQFGRYDVFHRLHDDGESIFSVASMMEPGTFDLEHMAGQQYSGVTMFAQLPGPIPGVHALRDLVACGKRLQETLGGTLQDERGVPLTVHRIDRLRHEIVDFERSQSREQRPS